MELSPSVITTGASGDVDTSTSCAIAGASDNAGSTVIENVPLSQTVFPEITPHAVKSNASAPMYPAFGVYTTVAPVTAPSDPCEGPLPLTIENVSATPAGAVPRSSSVAATSFVVCAESSVARTVVGFGGGGSMRAELIVTTASPVAPL